MSRTSRRFAAWIALAAIALHALAPLTVRAAPAAPGEHEICTAAGAKALPGGAPAGDHAAGMHCLSCPVGGDRAPAIVSATSFAAVPSAAEAPSAEAAAPAAVALRSAARSRAPPARS
jgi:DUF2946 family protein